MKHYKDGNDKIFAYPENGSQDHLIPESYIAITLDEKEALVQASIVITPEQILNTGLSDITWTRPSDGVEIQIRHPKFAPDGGVMQGVIGEMPNLTDTEDWIAKDNTWVIVSKQDLLDALAFRVLEIRRLYSEYKTATQNA